MTSMSAMDVVDLTGAMDIAAATEEFKRDFHTVVGDNYKPMLIFLETTYIFFADFRDFNKKDRALYNYISANIMRNVTFMSRFNKPITHNAQTNLYTRFNVYKYVGGVVTKDTQKDSNDILNSIGKKYSVFLVI